MSRGRTTRRRAGRSAAAVVQMTRVTDLPVVAVGRSNGRPGDRSSSRAPALVGGHADRGQRWRQHEDLRPSGWVQTGGCFLGGALAHQDQQRLLGGSVQRAVRRLDGCDHPQESQVGLLVVGEVLVGLVLLANSGLTAGLGDP